MRIFGEFQLRSMLYSLLRNIDCSSVVDLTLRFTWVLCHYIYILCFKLLFGIQCRSCLFDKYTAIHSAFMFDKFMNAFCTLSDGSSCNTFGFYCCFIISPTYYRQWNNGKLYDRKGKVFCCRNFTLMLCCALLFVQSRVFNYRNFWSWTLPCRRTQSMMALPTKICGLLMLLLGTLDLTFTLYFPSKEGLNVSITREWSCQLHHRFPSGAIWHLILVFIVYLSSWKSWCNVFRHNFIKKCCTVHNASLKVVILYKWITYFHSLIMVIMTRPFL